MVLAKTNDSTLVMIASNQIAIICPTKDRPEKVWRLLESVANSSILPGQIIIADGGHNLKPVVAKFGSRLNVKCLYCPEPGQILQRNYARSKLAPKIRLVVHLDDDIVLSPTALQNGLIYWNELASDAKNQLAGMALNVTNHPPKRNNFFRTLMFMRTEPRGRVWLSGFASPHVPVTENGFSDWLVGGAAFWCRSVLDKHPHPLSFRTRWAFCEDVLFSYPLSKTYRLAVCATAHVEHRDSYVNHPFEKRVFYARTQVLIRHYLISLNPDLSMLAFLWMTLCQSLGYLGKGLVGEMGSFGSLWGTLGGVAAVLRARLTGVSAEILVRRLAE